MSAQQRREDAIPPELLARAAEANARDFASSLHVLVNYAIALSCVGVMAFDLGTVIERQSATSAIASLQRTGSAGAVLPPDVVLLASGRECDTYFHVSIGACIVLAFISLFWTRLIVPILSPDHRVVGHRGIGMFECCTILHSVVVVCWLIVSIRWQWGFKHCEVRSTLFQSNQYFVKYIIALSLPLRIALADSAVPTSARELFFAFLFRCCMPVPAVPCDECTDRATVHCPECVSLRTTQPPATATGGVAPAAATTVSAANTVPTPDKPAAAGGEAPKKGRWLCVDHFRVHQKAAACVGHATIPVRQFWAEQKAKSAAEAASVLAGLEEAERAARELLDDRQPQTAAEEHSEYERQYTTVTGTGTGAHARVRAAAADSGDEDGDADADADADADDTDDADTNALIGIARVVRVVSRAGLGGCGSRSCGGEDSGAGAAAAVPEDAKPEKRAPAAAVTEAAPATVAGTTPARQATVRTGDVKVSVNESARDESKKEADAPAAATAAAAPEVPRVPTDVMAKPPPPHKPSASDKEWMDRHHSFWVSCIAHRFVDGPTASTPGAKAYLESVSSAIRTAMSDVPEALSAVDLKCVLALKVLPAFRELDAASGLALVERQLTERRNQLTDEKASPDDVKEFEGESQFTKAAFPELAKKSKAAIDHLIDKSDAYTDWMCAVLAPPPPPPHAPAAGTTAEADAAAASTDVRVSRADFERFLSDAAYITERKSDSERFDQTELIRSEAAKTGAAGQLAISLWLSWKADFWCTRFDKITNDPHVLGFVKEFAAKATASAAPGAAAPELSVVKIVESSYHYHFNSEVCLKKEALSGFVSTKASACSRY